MHTWCYILNVSKIMAIKKFKFFNCLRRFKRFMNSFHVIQPIIFIAVRDNGIDKK